MDYGLLVPLLIVVFMLGMAAGSAVEARGWRRNAREIQRKESWGRLFKVTEE